MTDVHPPKLEIFDVDRRTNTDPKGISRDVEEYRVEPFGLYLARPAPGRAQFHYLESWLLPALGLRVTDFWFSPGHERDEDFYLDVVEVRREGSRWFTTDLYLDIVLREGRGLEVLDTDELLAATRHGHLDEQRATTALERTYAAVDGLARHGHRLGAWLSTMDMKPSWRRHPRQD